MMRDITESILAQFDETGDSFLLEGRTAMRSTRHPQAMLMFAKMAAHHGDSLGRERDDHYDISHAMNFKAFAACLARHVELGVTQSREEPARPDPQVVELFRRQMMEELNLHQRACLRHGLRRSFYDVEADRFELRLTKRRRRSALTLVNSPAQYDLLDSLLGGRLSREELSEDDLMAAAASSAEHLHFVENADPHAWRRFEDAACTSEDLAVFTAFLTFLEFASTQVHHSLLYSRQKLLDLAGIFEKAFPNLPLGPDRLERLLELFSLTPQEADNLLLPSPFIRVNSDYLRYEGFERILSPAMGLLTIAIRKREKAWNDSVGGSLAKAADVVAASLPQFEHLKVAVRRKIGAAGDIDLALYDLERRHILLFEVKTVYDKHRTVVHMSGFEDAKVKIAHAVQQSRKAITAVESGSVPMSNLFGRKMPPPLQVTAGLLTWFDAIDLTVGTADEDVLSLNFATLRYLLKRSSGDLSELVRVVHELRNIWCIAERRPIDLQIPVPTSIEAQSSWIDSPGDLARLDLSPTTRAELATLDQMPDGWRDDETAQANVVSFFDDSLASFGGVDCS